MVFMDAVRKDAMLAVVGLWKDRDDIGDSIEYVREVREGDRLERLDRLAGSTNADSS